MFLSLNNAAHHYNTTSVVVLPEIELQKENHLLITGLSGSGKSTLLHVLAGVLKPTRGTLTLNGTRLYELREPERDRWRGLNIGIIYQQLHLIETLTVEDNIRLAQYMAGAADDGNTIHKLCRDLGIEDKRKSYPGQLSQGQKQRVSIARAIVNQPSLLLADEPTSSLDDQRCEDVIELLKMMADKTGTTLIISTHDSRVKNHFDHHINLDKLTMEVI